MLSRIYLCGLLACLCASLAAIGAGAPSAEEVEIALAATRNRLAELRKTCKESHPLVQTELRRIEELERRRRLPSTPETELALAREKLAELKRTCKEKHPAIQAQLARIAELERKLQTTPAHP